MGQIIARFFLKSQACRAASRLHHRGQIRINYLRLRDKFRYIRQVQQHSHSDIDVFHRVKGSIFLGYTYGNGKGKNSPLSPSIDIPNIIEDLVRKQS